MPSPKLLDKAQDPRLDRYELIGEIASGGMATVFLARLAGMGGFQRFVAIKRLHPHLTNETEFVQMFLDEARLAASIHHPHVVPILEVGTSQAGYYVVMEYIEGDTLAGLLGREAGRGSKLLPKVAMRIGLDALAGLHAAHELRDDDGNLVHLVHRDVSPQNILVGVDGSARITDFGVAKASSRLASTQSGTLKGKLAYMPPEQAKGSAHIDQRTDVFAMAVVIWECLAGRRLFKGETELETLNRLMFEPIPHVRSVDESIPEAIDKVVAQALEREPAKRFSSAAEFADALERAAQGVFPIASVRETAAYVQEIIGHDIQQQRAAVRAWLAEPSQGLKPNQLSQLATQLSEARPPASSRTPSRADMPPEVAALLAGAKPPRPISSKPPASASIEAAMVEEEPPTQAMPGKVKSASFPKPSPPPPGPLMPVTAPPPPRAATGAQALGPQSVTSAGVMAVPDPTRPSAPPPTEPQSKGRGALWLAPLALVVLGGTAFFSWTLSRGGRAPANAQTAAPVTAAASAPSAPSASSPSSPSSPTTASAAGPAETVAAPNLPIDSLPAAGDAKAGAPLTAQTRPVVPSGKRGGADKPADKPADKAADKAPADKPAEKPAEKPPAAGGDEGGYKNPYR